MILKVQKTPKGKLKCVNPQGEIVKIPTKIKRLAFSEGVGIEVLPNGGFILLDVGAKLNGVKMETKEVAPILQMIHSSYSNKPKDIILEEVKWKYLTRAVLRGKNVIMLGAAGTGKTKVAKCIAESLNRQMFIFNCGATQDPRSSLIGNTHFNKDTGTYFSKSEFITAITTPNAVIVLDELSRAHPDAGNILMPVLDDHQRYLRIDEAPDTPVINVAEGVCFIATANIGNEYTGTRVMDRALMDRFSTTIEMPTLNLAEEIYLLKLLYPDVANESIAAIASIAHLTREEMRTESPQIGTAVSTRLTIEMAGLISDGFSLMEAAEVAVYPFYPADGGTSSERVFVKQIVQKFIDDKSSDTLVDNQF